MLSISRLTVVALLTYGAAAIVLPETAAAQGCSRTDPYYPSCVPPDDDDDSSTTIPAPPPPSPDNLKVDCDIRDGNLDTDDFWIVNVGTATLKAGLKLRYIVPASDDRGAFLLPRDIPVGKKGKIRDLLSEKVPSGSECRIQILPGGLPQPGE